MAKKLFITATGTNVGKTYASCKILEHLGRQGVKIGAVKPIETGVSSVPADANKLLKICQKYNPNFRELEPLDICAYTFALPAAPYSADSENIIKIENIKDKIAELDALCDYLIIEGAGGLYVPIKSNYFMIDLIKELECQTVLVTPSHLGCINETLLSLKALDSSGIDYSWCVNLYKDREEFTQTTKPFYDDYFKQYDKLEDLLLFNHPFFKGL